MSANPEMVLISAMLNSQNHAVVIGAGVTPDWFTTYRRQYEWVERFVRRHGKTPSPALFKAKMGKRLLDVDDIEFAIDDLRKHHVRLTMLDSMLTSSDSISDGEDPLEVLHQLQVTMSSLNAQAQGQASEVDAISNWQGVFEDVSDRVSRVKKGGIAGIPSGFATLDQVTGGFQPGEVWVVAARLGHGKTWTMIRLACQALAAGHRVQYDALEQSANQVSIRMHTFLSGRYGKEIFKADALMRGEGLNLFKYRKFLRELPTHLGPAAFIVNDTSRGRLSPAAVEAQIQRNHPSIVFIDYITLMGSSGSGRAARDQWQQVAELSAELKGLAMKYRIPIVVAAQINRNGVGKRMPSVADLAGSDAIGHDADGVLIMQRFSTSTMRLRLDKYRNGKDGFDWYSEFRPNTGHYEEISRERAEEIRDNEADDEDL